MVDNCPLYIISRLTQNWQNVVEHGIIPKKIRLLLFVHCWIFVLTLEEIHFL